MRVKRQSLLPLRVKALISAIPLAATCLAAAACRRSQLVATVALEQCQGYRRAIRLQRNAHAALCSADTRSIEGTDLSKAEGGHLPGESSDGHLGAPRNCKLCNQHFLHQFLIHSLQFVSILSNFIIRACFVFDLALFFRVGCRDLNRCLQSLISHVSVYSG